MQTQVQKEWIENAIERVKLFGMLNYLPGGELTHIPFSLSPFDISKKELKEMTELTSYFSELILNVSQNWNFLEQHLSPIAKNDSFLKMLLNLKINEVTQSKQILIHRNDFFLTNNPSASISNHLKKNDNLSSSLIKHVEINTVSASFPYLITKLCKLHKNFFEQNKFSRIVENNPIKHLVSSFAESYKAYGAKNSLILMVTKTIENNSFDQIGLEQILWDKYKIKSVRKSLSEIYENGFLRNGHLILDGQIVAITYYRAGYAPEDFNEINAIKGRKLIESSSTIQIPKLSVQLAGMKKIQQVLTKPKIISEFISPEKCEKILNTFVKIHSLDEFLQTTEGRINTSTWSSLNTKKYVLKPQREGGNNNFFGKDITNFLSKLQKKELNTFVLMEKINPKTHAAILVVNNQADKISCVSEIGRYGICIEENGIILSNKDIGYLVRTKSKNVDEGGVCAGFACLNSLRSF